MNKIREFLDFVKCKFGIEKYRYEKRYAVQVRLFEFDNTYLDLLSCYYLTSKKEYSDTVTEIQEQYKKAKTSKGLKNKLISVYGTTFNVDNIKYLSFARKETQIKVKVKDNES